MIPEEMKLGMEVVLDDVMISVSVSVSESMSISTSRLGKPSSRSSSYPRNGS